MKISSIVLKDIKFVAHLHHFCLPDTVSSKLGIEYLTDLYVVLSTYPHLHIMHCAKHEDKIVGVITATRDLKKTQQCLRQSLVSRIPLLIQSFITRRVSIKECIEHMYVEQQLVSRFAHPFPEILTLFVHPSKRHAGIGRKLVASVEKIIIKENIPTLYVDTRISNSSAQKFYEAIGFIKQAKIMNTIVYRKDVGSKTVI